MSGFEPPSHPGGDQDVEEPALSDIQFSESDDGPGPKPITPAANYRTPPKHVDKKGKPRPEVIAPPPSSPNEKDQFVVCMPYESCLCMLLLGLAITVLFELLALGVEHWTKFDSGAQMREYGIHYCNDCPPQYDQTSWSCVKAEVCEINDDLGLCKNGEDMVKATGAYIGLTVFSLLFLILTIERVLYHYCKVDYGLNPLVYLFSLLFWVTQALAVLIWFGISGAEFQNDCERKPISTDRWDLCATDGPSIAIGTAFFVTICLVGTWAIHRRRTPEVRTELAVHTVKLWGFDYRACLLLPLVGMVLVLAILIATIATTNWVTISGEPGSLYSLKSYGKYRDYGYDCIRRKYCNVDEDSDDCTTFENLETASRVFGVLEILCIAVWTLWFEPLIHLFFNREYGYPPLNMAWGVILIMLHSAAIGEWFEVSEAKFSKTGCDADPAGVWNICAEAGPALAVLNALLILIVLGIYGVMYRLRRGAWKPVQKQEDNS